MQRLWTFFVCLTLVLGLGLSQLPRPCHGGDHGAMCEGPSCSCDASCTCHHQPDERALERALADASMCGRRFDPAQHARLLELARACQSHHQSGPNFAPPSKHWTADLPVASLRLMLAHASGPERAPPAYAATRFMSPNEHPPRLLS